MTASLPRETTPSCRTLSAYLLLSSIEDRSWGSFQEGFAPTFLRMRTCSEWTSSTRSPRGERKGQVKYLPKEVWQALLGLSPRHAARGLSIPPAGGEGSVLHRRLTSPGSWQQHTSLLRECCAATSQLPIWLQGQSGYNPAGLLRLLFSYLPPQQFGDHREQLPTLLRASSVYHKPSLLPACKQTRACCSLGPSSRPFLAIRTTASSMAGFTQQGYMVPHIGGGIRSFRGRFIHKCPHFRGHLK